MAKSREHSLDTGERSPELTGMEIEMGNAPPIVEFEFIAAAG